MLRRKARKAFTLIELLLVMVILAVLAAVVIPKLTGRVGQGQARLDDRADIKHQDRACHL